MSKISVDEMTRLAFVFAEQDRSAMAEADGSEYGREASLLAKRFREYRIKRWGNTGFEEAIKDFKTIDVMEEIRKGTLGAFGDLTKQRDKP